MNAAVCKTRRYSQEQLYEVVADVSHYSEFVPWCQHSVVVGNRDSQHLEVELEVGFKVFNERWVSPSRHGPCTVRGCCLLACAKSTLLVALNRYTSMVTLTPTKRVTSAVSDSSLFHRLDNAWEFQPGPTPQSCWLSFSIDFAFKSPLYSKLASVFFSEASELHGMRARLMVYARARGGFARLTDPHINSDVLPLCRLWNA